MPETLASLYMVLDSVAMIGLIGLALYLALRQRRLERQGYLAGLIIDSSDCGVLALDTSGRIIYLNPAGEAVFGINRARAIGREYEEVFAQINSKYWFPLRTLRQGVNYCGHVVERWPYGLKKCCFMIHTTRLFDRRDRLIGVAVRACALNLNASTGTEIAARERLAAAGQVAAAAAHEIRNPLTSVKGFMQLVDRETEGRQKEFIRISLRELKRIEDLIKEFLLLASPVGQEMARVDLGEIIQEAISITAREAEELNVRINASYCCRVTVKGDSMKLCQVFLNLIRNAFEAMPEGGRVDISVRHLVRDWVCVEVSDTGPGIAVGLETRIFDPFFSTKNLGPGLGLSICRRIIEDHRGRVTACNQIGGGARFVIFLPFDSAESLGGDTEVDLTEKERNEAFGSRPVDEKVGLN